MCRYLITIKITTTQPLKTLERLKKYSRHLTRFKKKDDSTLMDRHVLAYLPKPIYLSIYKFLENVGTAGKVLVCAELHIVHVVQICPKNIYKLIFSLNL